MKGQKKSSFFLSFTIIVLGCLFLGLTVVFDMVQLAESVIRGVGADSLLHGRGLYKLKMLHPLSILFGTALLFFGIISLRVPVRIQAFKQIWMEACTPKARLFLCLFLLYGAIACLTFSYYAVYAFQTAQHYAGLNQSERLRDEFKHSGYGNSFDVLEKALKTIPLESNIALICSNDIAHILHYYLYPRQIFSNQQIRHPSEIESEWIVKNEISHILWVNGFDPNRMRVGSDSMYVQILIPSARSGQHG